MQAMDPAGDADLGGVEGTAQSAPEPNPTDLEAEKIVVDLGDDSLDKTPSERPHRKGSTVLEAPSADDGDAGSCGEYPMIWPNLNNPEAGARFVLDDPTELYLWRGMRETGRTAMNTINQLAELVGRDFFKLAKVYGIPVPFDGLFGFCLSSFSQSCAHFFL